MNDATALMTRYLLGELSEREQADLETRYFEDPRLFDELVEVETSLIDDYVRGRLTPETQQRFETHFLADPRRRERVQFAGALARTIDRTDGETRLPTEPSTTRAGGSWFDWIRTPGFAVAFATVLPLAVVGTWLIVSARRTTEEIADAPATPRPADDVRPSPAETPPPPTISRPVLAVATLALTVGPGERSADAKQLPTLTIPPATDQVRFALTLREHDYARYRVIVRLIGGAELLRQGDLVPATAGAEPAFTLTAPATRFEPGDYLLTLQGATAGGEYEDLSMTIFRIARQP
jgi:anti-sigma factor RsiW